jgi:hypothetical protein
MPNLILDLEVDRVDLVDEGANSAAFIQLYKRKETGIIMTLEEVIAKMKPEHASVITDAIEKAKTDTKADMQKQVDDLTEEVKKAKDSLDAEVKKGKPAEPDFEEVMKGLDPAVQEVFKSMKAQKDAAEAVAKQAAEEKITNEAVVKAKELKSLPVEEAKLVEIMKSVTPEIHEILKAANSAIEENVSFEEVGKSKGNNDFTVDANEAWGKIEKAAEKIAEEQKISKAKAITQAVKENPELYRKYLEGGAN